MRTALVLAFLAPAALEAQVERIYLALDDHTDYMWAGDEEEYRQAFLEMIDYYLDLADQNEANPAEDQSRFNCDGSFWLWTYEHNRSPAEFARLIARIKSGHLSAPMTALVSCYGGQPAEAVLRGMYYAGKLERREELRFKLAVAMENQVLPMGLASLWAGSGARYSWRGICNCASRVDDAWDREHEIYYYTGIDGRRVLMKWNSQLHGGFGMGGYAEARYPATIVDYVTSSPGFIDRYRYPVIGCFGHGWDDLETLTDLFVNVAPSLANSSRQVIVSNEVDFFEDFEAAYGPGLPAETRSYGNEWDLYCASMAEVSAGVKRSLEKLRAAEALSTVVSLFDPTFMEGRQTSKEQAFMDLGLYWEHGWTADGHITRSARADWERHLAAEIADYVDTLHADGSSRLGGLIPLTAGGASFFVFNPLGWARTDVADLPWSDPAPAHVLELSSGEEVPSQRLTSGGGTVLRILAREVPAVGYKVYRVSPGSGKEFGDAAAFDGGVLENSSYRLMVSERGAIESLVAKSSGNRELARTLGDRSLNDLGPSPGTLSLESRGSVSVTLLASGPEPLEHQTRITLYREGDRIDIENRITQNFNDLYTWGFSFNLDDPLVRHEEVGAVATARLESEGGHYSPRSARYDWLSLNHFADITGAGDAGVTISNADCYFFKLGASDVHTLDASTAQISPLVGGQVDGSRLGIPSQGGDSSFLQRFALRAHQAYDQAAAMRFALEHQNPLVTGTVLGSEPRLPPDSFSAISVSNPQVLLWAFKPAEGGADRGLVARLWNLAGSPQTAAVQLQPTRIGSAWAASHIETDQDALPVGAAGLTADFTAQEIRTFRLTLESCAPPCRSRFVRGDANGDGRVDISDAIWNLFYLFAQGPSVCLEAEDVNGDGQVDVSDTIHELAYLFTLGPPPAPPFPLCGDDAPDGLSCEGPVTGCP